MSETRLVAAWLAWLVGLSALTLGAGLGRAGRLTYHEAFVAQSAREMIARGDALVPTIGGRPWLEKPPLIHWLVILGASASGRVGEWEARAPSAVAATLLVLGVAALAARRFGATVGLLTGLVQATTAWTVMRGRLAEADMILVCLVTWTVVAFDRLRAEGECRRPWRWAFFAGLGLTALAKGIGFGAVLVGSAVALLLAWDRDREALRKLADPRGWVLSGVLALTWPVLVVARYPSALGLWTLHVADRLAARPEHFAGEPWWQYGPALLWQVLPWTPLALMGAWPSLVRAVRQRGGGDRLLWAWAVGPAVLVSLATVKNAHYLIYALPPWSVWAALGLARVGVRLREHGWSRDRVRRWALGGFAGLGLAFGLGFAALGPRFDRRGVEWAFYEAAGRGLRAGEPLALLYDRDRAPYQTPFGPVPHDLAVRLFYLNRPACWRFGVKELADCPPAPGARSFGVIAHIQDAPTLCRLGKVERLAQGPSVRSDRTFGLYRITPAVAAEPVVAQADARGMPVRH